jgi:hypothetical protein
MNIEIQWDHPSHFLLDRNKNKQGLSIEFFTVPEAKKPAWFDAPSQIPLPIKCSSSDLI